MTLKAYRELNDTPEKRKLYLEKHYPGPSRAEIAATKRAEEFEILGEMIEEHPIVGDGRGGRVCGPL